ncbi:MAG: hypothetical protein Q4C91_19295 [Eubacteriales bacterium]|nr:hypothetical protein [Eubacteriales bacterium]
MEGTKKRKILLTGIVLIAVVSLAVGGYFTLRKGIYAGESFFYRISDARYEQNKSNYIERTTGSGFKIVADGEEKTVSVYENANLLVFSFSDGTSLEGSWDGEYLTDSQGFPVGWDEIQFSVNGEPIEAGISNAAYCQALCKIYFGKEETISVWYFSVIGILVYILGVVSILHPDEAHFFLSRWKYHNPELSETGRLMEQIGGVALCVLGVSIMSGILLVLVG